MTTLLFKKLFVLLSYRDPDYDTYDWLSSTKTYFFLLIFNKAFTFHFWFLLNFLLLWSFSFINIF